MFGFEYDGAIIMERSDVLEAALSTNPKTQKALQKLVRQVLRDARRQIVNSIKFDNGDPRQTRWSVRTAVYRKILGGNVNILDPKKSGSVKNTYVAPRKLRPGQRGGNRRPRNERTKAIQEYAPWEREFILRFVDSGTRQRFIGFRNANSGNRSRYESVRSRWETGGNRTGNRGSITGRNFFRTYGENALQVAAEKLSSLIETELANMLNQKK